LRSTPSTRHISRCDFPASSKVWTEIRKLAFKTFTPSPFRKKRLSVPSRRRSLARRRPAPIYGIKGGGVCPGQRWRKLAGRRGNCLRLASAHPRVAQPHR
jgi:hypothetical protein